MTVVFKVIKAPTDGRRCRSPAQHKLKNYKPITTPPHVVPPLTFSDVSFTTEPFFSNDSLK